MPLQFLQMFTRLGESAVSDKITVVLSGETASTRPAAPLSEETEAPLKTINPLAPNALSSTPRYATLVVEGPNKNEFGVKGKLTALPAANTGVVPLRVSGINCVVQACVVRLHAVVVTYVVELAAVPPVAWKFRGLPG